MGESIRASEAVQALECHACLKDRCRFAGLKVSRKLAQSDPRQALELAYQMTFHASSGMSMHSMLGVECVWCWRGANGSLHFLGGTQHYEHGPRNAV